MEHRTAAAYINSIVSGGRCDMLANKACLRQIAHLFTLLTHQYMGMYCTVHRDQIHESPTTCDSSIIALQTASRTRSAVHRFGLSAPEWGRGELHSVV